MTPDERNLLSDLANKIAQAPAPPKDAEAEEFIRTKIGSRPDALYMMTQTVLIQNIALQQAQAQIQQLQHGQSAGAPASSGSFLGGGGSGQRQSGYSGGGAPYNAPPPPQANYGAPSSPGFSSSGAGGFLRGAAQTAAGVAAGTLAVQGIESLFHGGGGFGGGGLFGGGGYGGAPVEENVVNNYYDNGPGGGYDNGGNDDYAAADNAADSDNSGYDDNGGFGDDGGGFDNSGDGGDSFV